MKRKTLTTALLAGLTGTVGIANISNAVNINPDGLGQTLIYPYYTTRDGTDTLLSVVNTTSDVKAVKVRFLEGENSQEVLDFNLYLSAFDVWTAAITDDGAGGRIFTNDNSCVVFGGIPDEGQPFLTFGFDGDSGSQTADRTREGYFEMIEMGVVTDATFAAAATHVDGVPADCSVLDDSWNGGRWDANAADGVTAPEGGLFGGASLINVEGGFDASYNATALDAFSQFVIHTDPLSLNPSLNSANPPNSTVFNGGSVVTSGWDSGAEAVSALFMHDQIMNEYVLDDETASGTDWVVTFPTKRFFVARADINPADDTAHNNPFTQPFVEGTACEPVELDIFDREERTPTTGIGDRFSPPAPGPDPNALCWEVTTVTFNDSNVLGSVLSQNIDTPFQNGWLNLSFASDQHRMDSNDGDVYRGLPAVGFQVQTFTNGALETEEGPVLSNYAGLFDHRATRDISGD